MAYESNTPRSLTKTTFGNLVPYPRRYRMESSKNTCDPNTPTTKLSLSVNTDLPNIYPTSQSIRRRLPGCFSLDDEIKKLLHEKLVQRVVQGKPFQTIDFHRQQLTKQVVDWIGSSSCCCSESDDYFTHELVGLFAREQQNLKDVPTNNSEWIKLLNKWLRAKTLSVDRQVYQILAVDGFRGFKPQHLKFYLPNVLSPLRKEYESHICSVRKMYKYFDEDATICCLNGPDSACVVFLTLIDFYALQMRDDLMLDDQVRFRVQRVKSWVEGNLQQHVDYFRDVKNVDERLYQKLCKIYTGQFKDDGKSWKMMGRELLSNLNCNDV